MSEITARDALVAEANDAAHKYEWTQTSSHVSCTVGNEPDEDGYVECDECGMMWPSENDA